MMSKNTQKKHEIFRRDNYRCQKQKCDNSPYSRSLQLHYKISASEGGLLTPDNVITLCKGCHGDECKKYQDDGHGNRYFYCHKKFRREGQYHECVKCNEIRYTDRTYIRIRKYEWDWKNDIMGKANPRIWQPIGWFCQKCRFLDIDTDVDKELEERRKKQDVINEKNEAYVKELDKQLLNFGDRDTVLRAKREEIVKQIEEKKQKKLSETENAKR